MTEEIAETPPQPRRSRGGLGSNLGATVTILVLNLATGVILAREFGPEGRGEVALILLWPNILVALAQLGLPESITFHTAKGGSKIGAVLGSGLVIATLRAVAVIAIGAAILPFILEPQGNDVLQAGFIYLLGFVPGHAYNLLLLAVINGQERFHAVAILRVLVIGAASIPIVVLAATGSLTVTTVALAYVGAQIVTFVVSFALLRGEMADLSVSRPILGDLFHYGVRAHVGTISASLNLRVDQLVLSLFLSVRDLGLYVVGATLATLTSVVGATVGYVVVPITARAKNDAERIADARGFTLLTVLASAAIALPLVAFAPDVIRIVFGEDFVEVADVARVLLVGSVAFSTARCLEAILRAIGRPWQASVGELIALGVTFAGLAALLPLFGLMGAALASLVAYSTSLVWMLRVTARELDVRVRDLIVPNRAEAQEVAALLRRARASRK